MAEDDSDARQAHSTAHIAYALVDALLKELDEESPASQARLGASAAVAMTAFHPLPG